MTFASGEMALFNIDAILISFTQSCIECFFFLRRVYDIFDG